MSHHPKQTPNHRAVNIKLFMQGFAADCELAIRSVIYAYPLPEFSADDQRLADLQ